MIFICKTIQLYFRKILPRIYPLIFLFNKTCPSNKLLCTHIIHFHSYKQKASWSRCGCLIIDTLFHKIKIPRETTKRLMLIFIQTAYPISMILFGYDRVFHQKTLHSSFFSKKYYNLLIKGGTISMCFYTYTSKLEFISKSGRTS